MYDTLYTPTTGVVVSQHTTLEVLSPDDAWLAVANWHHHVVDIFKTERGVWRLWQSYYGHRDGVHNRQGTITALTWLPDSFYLVSASSTGSMHLWNRRGIHERTLKHAQVEKRYVKALSFHESYGLQIVYEDEEDEHMAHVN